MPKQKNVGGRPKKPEAEKVRRVQISLPPKIHDKGKAKAERAGKTFSAWLGELIKKN